MNHRASALLLGIVTAACAAAASVTGSADFSEARIPPALNTTQVEYGAIRTQYGWLLTRSSARWGEEGVSRIVRLDPETGAETPLTLGDDAYSYSDPAIDPVTQRLCFVATIPVFARAQENFPGDIWCADRGEGRWVNPERLPEPVNSAAREYSPSFDGRGRLFFASDRPGGLGKGDVYTAERTAGGGWQVHNAGPAVNSAHGEWNVTVDESGSTLVFEASSRDSNRTASGDLYYSERTASGWSPAVALSRLNSDRSDLMARWVDESGLLFASARGGGGDVDHYLARRADWEPLGPAVLAVSRSAGELVILDPNDLSELRRIAVGEGPHEVAATDDGRLAMVPLLGVYPQPHREPVDARPPFLARPSAGLTIVDPMVGVPRAVEVRNCERPHGAAVDAQARRLWVTCENEGAIIELDGDDLSERRRFQLKKGVHKVSYHRAANALFTSNPDSGVISRLDLVSGTVVQRRTGAGAEGFAVGAQGDVIWVANSTDATVCRLEGPALEISWCESTGGKFPIALVAVPARDELWVSNLFTSELVVLDLKSGGSRGRFALPTGALDLAYNHRDALIYASLPRHNRVVAIDSASREIVAGFAGVMEVDDIDTVMLPKAPSHTN